MQHGQRSALPAFYRSRSPALPAAWLSLTPLFRPASETTASEIV